MIRSCFDGLRFTAALSLGGDPHLSLLLLFHEGNRLHDQGIMAETRPRESLVWCTAHVGCQSRARFFAAKAFRSMWRIAATLKYFGVLGILESSQKRGSSPDFDLISSCNFAKRSAKLQAMRWTPCIHALPGIFPHLWKDAGCIFRKLCDEWRGAGRRAPTVWWALVVPTGPGMTSWMLTANG